MQEKRLTTIANPFEIGFYGFLGAFCAYLAVGIVLIAAWLIFILVVAMMALGVSERRESKPKPKPVISRPIQEKTVPVVKLDPIPTFQVKSIETLNSEMKELNVKISKVGNDRSEQMVLIREKVKLQNNIDELNGAIK